MYFIRERERETHLLNNFKKRARTCAKVNNSFFKIKEKLSYFKMVFTSPPVLPAREGVKLVRFSHFALILNCLPSNFISSKGNLEVLHNIENRTFLAPSPWGEGGGRGTSSFYRKLRSFFACIRLLSFRTSRCFTPISPKGDLMYARFSDFVRQPIHN